MALESTVVDVQSESTSVEFAHTARALHSAREGRAPEARRHCSAPVAALTALVAVAAESTSRAELVEKACRLLVGEQADGSVHSGVPVALSKDCRLPEPVQARRVEGPAGMAECTPGRRHCSRPVAGHWAERVGSGAPESQWRVVGSPAPNGLKGSALPATRWLAHSK